MSKHVCVLAFVLVCNQFPFSSVCSDMNNRSIAWWLRQIELPQYTKTLESEYYGLEVCKGSKGICYCLLGCTFFFCWDGILTSIRFNSSAGSYCCLSSGFAVCYGWRAEGCWDRRCSTQRNNPRSAFKGSTQTGPAFWSGTKITHKLIRENEFCLKGFCIFFNLKSLKKLHPQNIQIYKKKKSNFCLK